jgi:hypothetical protein
MPISKASALCINNALIKLHPRCEVVPRTVKRALAQKTYTAMPARQGLLAPIICTWRNLYVHQQNLCGPRRTGMVTGGFGQGTTGCSRILITWPCAMACTKHQANRFNRWQPARATAAMAAKRRSHRRQHRRSRPCQRDSCADRLPVTRMQQKDLWGWLSTTTVR